RKLTASMTARAAGRARLLLASAKSSRRLRQVAATPRSSVRSLTCPRSSDVQSPPPGAKPGGPGAPLRQTRLPPWARAGHRGGRPRQRATPGAPARGRTNATRETTVCKRSACPVDSSSSLAPTRTESYAVEGNVPVDLQNLFSNGRGNRLKLQTEFRVDTTSSGYGLNPTLCQSLAQSYILP